MRKVKFSWEDQIRMKEKKEKDKINLYQSQQHHSMEVKVQKNSFTDNSKKVDNYDLYLIEKALYNLRKEIDMQSPKSQNTNDKLKMEIDFHEQYFS
jgi:hypothetical protein